MVVLERTMAMLGRATAVSGRAMEGLMKLPAARQVRTLGRGPWCCLQEAWRQRLERMGDVTTLFRGQTEK